MERADIKQVPKLTAESKALFYAKVRKVVDSDCWNWIACVNNLGYGRFWIPEVKNEYLAHRVAYVNFYGLIPDGLLVLHRCDNTRCVNPLHLFVGTNKDNTQDMIAKGRGEYNSKLTREQVNEIRNLRATTNLSQREIGDKFGVCHQTVSFIVNNKQWKQLA